MQSIAAVSDKFRLFSFHCWYTRFAAICLKTLLQMASGYGGNCFRNAESFEDGTIILVSKIRFLIVNLKMKQLNNDFS